MAYEQSIRRYRQWYAKLLRLYSRAYQDRFGEEMEQTFNDLLRECAHEKRGLLGRALWMFFETFMQIMREKLTFMMIQNKNIIRIFLATAFLLFIPFIAMQFTDEVVWDLADFVIAFILLFGAGLAYELVVRKRGQIAYRVAVGTAVGAALLLIWMNLAVGLIGNEENPANLMYLGVLAVGLLGAAIARLQPRGMARALFAMALAQALVPLIAMMIWKPPMTSGVVGVLGVNAIFVMLFVGSALLFQRASATNPA